MTEKDAFWAELAESLRAMPEDFVLGWYSDDMSIDKPWETDFVEVWVEELQLWTIGPPWEADDPDCDHDILWPPDVICMIFEELADGCHCGNCFNTRGILAVPPPHLEPNFDLIGGITQLQSQATRPYRWSGTVGYSHRAVSHAIEDWCMAHAGRFVQAAWCFDHGPSPLLAKVQEVKEAIMSGMEPVYMIKPGAAEGGEGLTVLASDQVMEFLLQEELLGEEGPSDE